MIDDLAGQVRPAAPREARRWRQQYVGYDLWSKRTDFTSFDEEVNYIKGWMRARWSFMEQKLEELPSAAAQP